MADAMNIDYDGRYFQLNVFYKDSMVGRQHEVFHSLVGEFAHLFFQPGARDTTYWLAFSDQAKKELGKDKVGFLEHMVDMYNHKGYRKPLYVPVNNPK